MVNDILNRLIAWSGMLVAPDWGALVALIPLILLVAGVAFVAITAAKWSRVGPAQRGPGRRQPLGPDGRPLRAPTAGPMLVATGAFLLAFGVLVGVAWLALGACVTASGLVWWLLELRRGAGPGATARRGRLTPTRLIVTCVGAVAIAVLAATSRVVPETPSGGSAATPPATSPAPGASLADGASQPPAASQPSGDLTLDAENLKFLQTALWAPAGQPFSVAFDNRDNVPHNLEIREAAGSVLFMGDIVTGPTIVVYDVAALPAGLYPFVCTVHPSMTGTLTVK